MHNRSNRNSESPPTASRAASRSSVIVHYVGAGLFYSIVTCFFFKPVWGNLTSQLIGDGGDNLLFYWNAWWIDHSLLAGRNPLWCDMQFVPLGLPLVLHTLSVIPSACIALLGHAMTLVLAYNLVVIALYPLAGLCLFALARYITRDSLAALIGGLAFMMCPNLTSKLLGHLNLQSAALLPLFTLALLRALRDEGRVWRWMTAGVFVLFSSIHSVIFAANITLWSYLFFSGRTGRWREWTRIYLRALAPTLILACIWAVITGSYMLRYHLEAAPYRTLEVCPEPLCYVLPMFPTSIWKQPFAAYPMTDSIELAVYLGWFVLPIAIVGWYVRRREPLVRLMLVLFLTALVLSLGHKLQWNRHVVSIGLVPIRLPMGIYRYVPVLGSIGQSGRYFVIAYMAMGVGVAGALAAFRTRFATRGATAAAAVAIGLICVDYGFRPITTQLPHCPIQFGPGIVMDPRLGESRALYAQTVHGRPLMGGYIARIPSWIYDSYRADAQLGWFFQRTDRRDKPPEPGTILGALQERNIAFVCVDLNSQNQQVLEGAGLARIYADNADVFLQVPPRVNQPLRALPRHAQSRPG